MSKLFSLLNELLAQNAGKRVNGRVASDRTATAAGEVLRTCFRTLIALGYRLESPRNISHTHITALCRHWHQKGHSPKTMQAYLSQLRNFGRWVGKGDLVKSLHTYLPDVPRDELVARTVASHSKSWTENGIDVAAKIREADSLDPRFGLMLRMQLAFGLRRMEVIQMQPWKNDRGDKFAAYATKGGRPRDIYIKTPEQRAVLDLVKQSVRKDERLGWSRTRYGKPASLKYSIGRYAKLLPRIGITKETSLVTGHGLRAQYAENAALIANVIPPTLGGSAGQMPRDQLKVKLVQTSELLGHSRVSVTTAYYGTFGRETVPDSPDRAQINIGRGFKHLPREQLCEVPDERIADCMRLVNELAAIKVYVTAPEVQALWQRHSQRHGRDWAAPLETNLAALEAAATSICAA